MKIIIFAFFFLLLLSCSDQPEPATRQIPSPQKTDSLIARSRKPVLPDYPENLPTVRKFPGRDYHKVVAYQLSGKSYGPHAAAVFKEQTGKKAELTEAQTAAGRNV